MEEMNGEKCDLPQYSDFCEISEKDLPYGLTAPKDDHCHWLSEIIRMFADKGTHGAWNRNARMNHCAADRVNYYESLDLLAHELDFEIRSYQFLYMPMELLLPIPSYRDLEFASILQEISYNLFKVDGETYDFICYWLREFNVGSDFRINPVSEEESEKEFQLLIKDVKTDQWFDSTQIGRGALQIVSILFRIGLINIRYTLASNEYRKILYKLPMNWQWSDWSDINREKLLASPLIILEEPEICLHPCAQSKLAEMMIHANMKFGIRFIVETHSEYIIRCTQVLVAKESYDDFTIRYKNPFKVYYFPSYGIPYDMEYRPNGRFERPFGKGFFDEATKWNDQLIWGITQ